MQQPQQSHNLTEEVCREVIERFLETRFDICTCGACRKAMVREAAALIEPQWATLTDEELPHCLQQTLRERKADINHALHQAIEKVSTHPPHPVTEDRQEAFRLLIKRILHDRGLDFRNYHQDLLKRRFALRIRKNNLASYGDYMNLLIRSPREYDRLFETLCVNVSEFFRDPPVWVTMQYLVDTMMRGKLREGGKEWKIWSAGCACGEEIYSMAMLVQEVLKPYRDAFRVTMLATDVDKACLDEARKGIYPRDRMQNVERRLLARYCLCQKDTCQVRDTIRQMVDFEYLDLTSQPFPGQVDILLCRNVFIYFNRHLQEQILRQFHQSMAPGGYIILGKSEMLLETMRKLFEEIDANARIYRKV